MNKVQGTQEIKRQQNNPLSKVIDNGFCIGCGACSVKNSQIEIEETDIGTYQANLNGCKDESVAEVCPFLAGRDETTIGKKLYHDNAKFDSSIGYYCGIYTGYVNEESFRENGSSGGLLTWLLVQLLQADKIDAVVHVGATDKPGELFNYTLSTTIESVQNGAKSKYYPITYSEVLNKVKEENLRIAFVGVPCFVKSIRLLCEADLALKQNVKYCISLFCGHLKSKGFSQMIAWQQGVPPGQLTGIDFRVKNNKASHRYSLQVRYKQKTGQQITLPPIQTQDLYGMDWGLGLFKPKACDWCDDIAGEIADITFGDAWLPEYSSDSSGRNIVVVRNKEILNILEDSVRNNQIELVEEPVEKVYQSQAGNYRHRQEGLSVRIEQAVKEQQWFPVKRVKQDTFEVPRERKEIYLHRLEISEKSHIYFQQAKLKNSFILFLIKILPLQIKYYILNKRATKHALVYSYQLLRYFLRKKT